jgi:hypothetical protein
MLRCRKESSLATSLIEKYNQRKKKGKRKRFRRNRVFYATRIHSSKVRADFFFDILKNRLIVRQTRHSLGSPVFSVSAFKTFSVRSSSGRSMRLI